MKTVRLEPTSTAQWQALVHEAVRASNTPLSEMLESYLVFLLMRFSRRPDMAARALCLSYLEAAQLSRSDSLVRLRDVGDQCLLLSGLFPHRARRRRVRVNYFIQLGQSAYQNAAATVRHGAAELYEQLSHGFVGMKDVLQAMRGMDITERGAAYALRPYVELPLPASNRLATPSVGVCRPPGTTRPTRH